VVSSESVPVDVPDDVAADQTNLSEGVPTNLSVGVPKVPTLNGAQPSPKDTSTAEPISSNPSVRGTLSKAVVDAKAAVAEPGQNPDQIAGYDFWETLPDISAGNPAHRWCIRVTPAQQQFDVQKALEGFENLIKEQLGAVKYAFQLEKGPKSGLLHFQGYVNLSSKKRQNQVVNSLIQFAKGNQWAKPAMDENAAINYCTKKASRVAGPITFPKSLPWSRIKRSPE
jgi:hypothetical protein